MTLQYTVGIMLIGSLASVFDLDGYLSRYEHFCYIMHGDEVEHPGKFCDLDMILEAVGAVIDGGDDANYTTGFGFGFGRIVFEHCAEFCLFGGIWRLLILY